MNTESERTSYEKARRSFEELEVEEQASFVVEAATATVAKGLLRVGETLAEGVEDVVREARQRRADEASSTGPSGAASETAQEPSGNGSRSSDDASE